MNYSILTYVLLLGSLGPLILAAKLWGTVDWYPWALLLAIGVVLAIVGRRAFAALQLRLHRVSAAAVAGEVAPGHAPGGWFVWLAVPLWTTALGLCLNVTLDGSPAEEHPSQVIDVGAGKSRTVTLRDYRGAGTIGFHGGNSLVAGLREGQAVTIVARRGFFGWAWIESIR